VGEAARLLGISKDAVRMRIRRGTLRSEKTDNKVYVWMDDEAYGDHNAVHAQDEVEGSAWAEELREQVRYLREQLDREREARTEERRRHDTLMAQLMQRIPELEPPRAQPEASETVDEEPAEAEPRSAAGGAQEAARRPWWRRVFGG
jgi:hypothetical protein